MTGALGYGLEYTYSVMERIRMTGAWRRRELAVPDDRAPGQEAPRSRRCRPPKRTSPPGAISPGAPCCGKLPPPCPLPYAGADLLVLYHPESLAVVRRGIARLADNRALRHPERA